MTIQAEGHWGGDPLRYCGRLTVTAATSREAKGLAQLNRVLSDPVTAARLLELAELAERVEQEELELALAEAAPC